MYKTIIFNAAIFIIENALEITSFYIDKNTDIE